MGTRVLVAKVVAVLLVASVAGTGHSGPVGAVPDAPTAAAAQGREGASAQATALDPFYEPPDPLPAVAPGTLLRAERTTVSPLLGVPLPVLLNAWRVMYTSTDAAGQRMAVTGTLIVPGLPWLVGSRPLVSYAVGGHGMGEQCTPSVQLRAGTQPELSAIAPYLLQGWAVVVTDYQRYPVHTFVNSDASGFAVLDAARAAPQVSGAGLAARPPLAITGYSQGGHAAAAAAERQPAYAPGLDLRGVAAGGVPADLAAVADAVDGDFLFGVVPMAVASLHSAYPELTLDGLSPAGREAVASVLDECIAETATRFAFGSASSLTAGGVGIDAFFADQPGWAARVAQQRLGGRRPAVPVLAYQGLFDPWVPHAVTEQLAADWCATGANVRFSTYPLAEHFAALAQGVPEVVSWIQARFAGRPATPNC